MTTKYKGPRSSSFYGMKSSPEILSDGTWIEEEELAYPSGGFTRRARIFIKPNPNNPMPLPSGLRIVKCSLPDTYFTIPARLRYRGKTIKGHISLIGYEEIPTFTPVGKA